MALGAAPPQAQAGRRAGFRAARRDAWQCCRGWPAAPHRRRQTAAPARRAAADRCGADAPPPARHAPQPWGAPAPSARRPRWRSANPAHKTRRGRSGSPDRPPIAASANSPAPPRLRAAAPDLRTHRSPTAGSADRRICPCPRAAIAPRPRPESSQSARAAARRGGSAYRRAAGNPPPRFPSRHGGATAPGFGSMKA